MQLRRPFNVVKSKVKRDPYNHHYLGSRLLARELGRLGSLPRYGDHREDWKDLAGRQGLPVAFLPLQVWPEVNSEYWLRHRPLMPYPSGVLQGIRHLRGVATVLVKEHPQHVGVRQPSFLEALRQEPHVIMAPPSVPSSVILETCDVAMVWSGSIGLEASLTGKPILDFGGTYLTDNRAALPVSSIGDLEALGDSLPTLLDRGGLTEAERVEFLQRTLGGYLPGRVHIERGFADLAPSERSAIDQLGYGLREHYAVWREMAQSDIDTVPNSA